MTHGKAARALLAISLTGCATSLSFARPVTSGPTFETLTDAGNQAPPAPIHRASIRTVVLGDLHGCLLSGEGEVHCWGDNAAHQVAPGDAAPRPLPTRVPDLEHVVDLVATFRGTCAIQDTGTVQCWGEILGRAYEKPTPIEGLRDIRTIALTRTDACVLETEGAVRCWGKRAPGGEITDPRQAQRIEGVRAPKAILIAGGRSCALEESGRLVCWGYRGAAFRAPAPIPEMPPLASVSSFAGEVCGVAKDRTVHCLQRTLPTGFEETKEAGWGAVDQLAVGALHACAIDRRRKILCRGADLWGSTGARRVKNTFAPIAEVEAFGTVKDTARLFAGGMATCVLQDDSLRCIGDNEFGELGNGELSSFVAPFRVPDIHRAQRVVTVDSATCALTDKRVSCWGVGRGLRPEAPGWAAEVDAPWVPRSVDLAAEVKDLFIGPRPGEVCASLADGALTCFQAGAFSYPKRDVADPSGYAPRTIEGVRDVVAIARRLESYPGAWSFYALRGNGEVVLVEGRARVQSSAVPELARATALATSRELIAANYGHNQGCVIRGRGHVACFDLDPNVPPKLVDVPGIQGAIDLAAFKGRRFVARLESGRVVSFSFRKDAIEAKTPGFAATEVEPLRNAKAISHDGILCGALEKGAACETATGSFAPTGESRFVALEANGIFSLSSGAIRITHGPSPSACAIAEDGDVQCWGQNRGHALGSPNRARVVDPVRLAWPPP